MYELCKKYMNQNVEIHCHDGSIHRGTITKVDHHHVYIKPMNDFNPNSVNNGPGLFFWGPGYGYGYGYGYGIALGSIALILALGLIW
ncbi:hypothetical protein [Terrilactibacillus laevilacticus]|uniref:Uncharacterized protein n=1 Tax=Terrilactibacillus laevilacticus TaxID=1380157 RepID=A0ABW5PSR5_9BACI|nr:hypothetical protein [Terrilactibacillus laevilacticus]